jgi:hypothetical protein
MPLARTTVYVREDCDLGERSFVGRSGDPCAWLEIGDDEVGVWGSPAAMRRLAAAVLATAEAADERFPRGQRAELAWQAGS